MTMRLAAGPRTSALRRLRAQHGHLFAHKITVPVNLIQSVTDRITLNIYPAEDAERLQSP